MIILAALDQKEWVTNTRNIFIIVLKEIVFLRSCDYTLPCIVVEEFTYHKGRGQQLHAIHKSQLNASHLGQ